MFKPEHMCCRLVQVYFKTNKYFIRERPNLKNYVRDLYHIPGADVFLALPLLRVPHSVSPKPEVTARVKICNVMPQDKVVPVCTMIPGLDLH